MEDHVDKGVGKNAKKKPFKLTRELVRLALNFGWTQQEIADKCRTQQSIVSAWKKGAKFGTESQLMPLLEIFGHKLRRNTFRAYWALDSTTQDKTFFRIEGKVVFTEVLFEVKSSSTSSKPPRRNPLVKLVVHYQGVDKFRVVIQARLGFDSSTNTPSSNTEDAMWSARVLDQQSNSEVLAWVDDFAQTISEKSPHSGLTLPFLFRQALLNHGFPVPGIVDYPAIW
ncbi:hypothetical protein [Pseudomonas syringae]|uniref:hypothetical protein n=1 Tax=Pseudomonas syringae TaxID=317 RepID=UPI000CD118D0|nr:hypothetical protein [Pseudomonas syringae]POD54618.1 hypothetical protein BKM15_05630 [Pseudomonas syringae pv. syringae]MCF5732959.1 hypothetical protein [Pseudomonas syringae]MCF5738834.1 hypothetical protein [Pseudomonas syringae]MCF5751839.1 hypothetical protein [Pseudomonas syringae]MCF5757842.1 hypothetical protein [Pseudomonas syringae]